MLRSRAQELVLAFAVPLLLSYHPLFASQNATLVGGVYDSAGNPIPGAKVYLKNSLTGFARTQITSTEGEYTFNDVPPTNAEEGEYYLLSIEKSGLKSSEERKVTVNVGDVRLVQPPITLSSEQAEAPPALAPPTPQPAPPTPAASQPAQPQPAAPPPPAPPAAVKLPPKVQPVVQGKVEAAVAPTVAPDLISNTVGGVIDSRTVRTLPLADRDFLDLALLAPGTYPVEQGSILEGASLVVNGIRANMNNFLLDGADDNDYTINQSLPFQLVEAMQEFRVQAGTSPPEFGRSGGAQINTISRRGLNTVHGGLFEFHRNSRLSPDNFFSVYDGGTFDRYRLFQQRFDLGDPFTSPTLAALFDRRKPEVIQNQFGGNVGGAMKKDKLFGFFNWESFRVSNPRPIFERVPGLRLRQPTNPVTGLPQDPTATALFKLYPAPNVSCPPSDSACPDFADPNFFSFFVGESANNTATDNFVERIDWRKSDRASMSFKHNIQRIDQVQGGAVPQTPTYPGSGTQVNGRNQNFSYNYVQQFSDHTGNELRLGWNRFRLATQTLDRSINPSNLGSGIGFKNLNFVNQGLPTLSVGGFQTTFAPFSLLGSDLSVPSTRADNVWSVADNLSYTRGRHNWKFGGEFRYVRLDVRNEALGRGVLNFSGGPFVARFGLPDLASIARVSPLFGGGFDRSFRTKSLDWFVQDQWRPRPGLSFNYGLRYEVNTAPVEARDRLVNLYPGIGGPDGSLIRANGTTEFDPFGKVIGTASAPAPRAGFETDKNNWGPRFGFAWSPWRSNKTVIRSAYAVVFDQEALEPSVNMLLNPPFVLHDVSLFPLFSLNTTFGVSNVPGQLPGASVPSPTLGWFRLPYSVASRDPNTRTPYVHQFNFGIQQQLGNKAVFEAAYVGSAAHKLPRLHDLSPCNVTAPAPRNPSNPFGCFAKPFIFTSLVEQENSASSSFHSLLLRIQAREFRGFNVQAHYQFAKSIDEASSLQPQVFLFSPGIASLLTPDNIANPDALAGFNNVSPTLSLRPGLPLITTRPRVPQDFTNLRGDRGRSDFDVRQRFVVNFIYDIPRWERLRGLGKGWQLAGIATMQSGQPFTVFADYYGIPFRPNVRQQPVINDRNPDAAIDNGNFPSFTRPGAFRLNFNPATGLFAPGNLGRNTFTGPRFMNTDFAILKSTSLGADERRNIQFRVEFFNAFNGTNFRQPYSNGGVLFLEGGLPTVDFDPFFGRILQSYPATEIQFAIKLNF